MPVKASQEEYSEESIIIVDDMVLRRRGVGEQAMVAKNKPQIRVMANDDAENDEQGNDDRGNGAPDPRLSTRDLQKSTFARETFGS